MPQKSYPSSDTSQLDALGGKLLGALIHDGKVAQYRGIPYGKITERFQEPKLREERLDGDVLDCREYGPVCPQGDLDGERAWFALPDGMENRPLDLEVQDEFRCLNLIITRPTNVATDSKLPVLVYIHGGFFSLGTANKKAEDLAGIVAESVKQGNPIIGVSLNYRLNLFGFATINGKGNFGLMDQRCGLEWVRRNVEDFGGDLSHISLSGNSTGAASVLAHLQTAREGLFQRAIVMSGSLVASPPKSLNKQEATMRKVCKILNITWDQHYGERLKNVTVDDLKLAFYEMGATQISPTLDSFFNDRCYEPEDPKGIPSWCDAIMLGDNEFETTYWSFVTNMHDPVSLKNEILRCIPPRYKEAVVKTYRLSEQDHAADGALNILHDVIFHHPVKRTSEAWKKQSKGVYQYILDERNPHNPEQATQHDINLLFTWGSYDLGASKTADSVRRTCQSKIIDFLHGKPPWKSGTVFAFGPGGRSEQISNAEYSARRRIEAMSFLDELSGPEAQSLVSTILRGQYTAPAIEKLSKL